MIDTSGFQRFTNLHKMMLQNGHTRDEQVEKKKEEMIEKSGSSDIVRTKRIKLEPERYADSLEARSRRQPPRGGGGIPSFFFLLFILFIFVSCDPIGPLMLELLDTAGTVRK